MSCSCHVCYGGGRLSVGSELDEVIRAAGVTAADIESLMLKPRTQLLRQTALSLLRATPLEAAQRADLDVLLDMLLGIDEVR